MAEGELKLDRLHKSFDRTTVVDNLSAEISVGEFFTIVGPSGCGKTTTLRMLAGFEKPTRGRIILDGRDVQNVPPYKRNVNTVFQNYALFPHYKVFDNVAYGLRRAKCPRNEIKKRVRDILELVQLGEMATRKPNQLSGGQKQRVALARALVLNPSVLLLDEPLGALDAKLRKQLQVDLRSLQQRLGITSVFVTHDQEEALTMSDRIAVMNNGRFEQVGNAREVYEYPATEFVASFLGASNLLNAESHGRKGDDCHLSIGDIRFRACRGDLDVSGSVKCVIRPERVRIEAAAMEGENRFKATIEHIVYLGNSLKILARLANKQIVEVLVPVSNDDKQYEEGTEVTVYLPADNLRVLGPAKSTISENSPVREET